MRGQTTLDFAMGIVIFLAVILFVFSFVPGILEPFDVEGGGDSAKSNRIANSLTQEKLGSADEPYVLDRFCTVAFFNDSRTTAPADCNWDEPDIRDEFDLGPTIDVNVTIVGNINETNDDSTMLCWTDSSDEGTPAGEPGLDEQVDCDSSDTMLAAGDDPPASGSTTITSRRVVSLHDESVTMKVIVW